MNLGLESILAFAEKAPLWFWAATGGTAAVAAVVGKLGVRQKTRVEELETTKSPSAEQFLDQPRPEPSIEEIERLGKGEPDPPAREEAPAVAPPEAPRAADLPSMEPPKFNGGRDNLDRAMEYFIFNAFVNSAKDANFEGLTIKTKFGSVTVEKAAPPPPPNREKVLERKAERELMSHDPVPETEPLLDVDIPASNQEDESNG